MVFVHKLVPDSLVRVIGSLTVLTLIYQCTSLGQSFGFKPLVRQYVRNDRLACSGDCPWFTFPDGHRLPWYEFHSLDVFVERFYIRLAINDLINKGK